MAISHSVIPVDAAQPDRERICEGREAPALQSDARRATRTAGRRS
jgi:hypothetical protein